VAAATANVTVDAERSVFLALAAVDETRSADGTVLPEAEEALHRAINGTRVELRVPDVGGAVVWSPDGATFATEGPDSSGIIEIRDARTGESVRSFHGHDIDVIDVSFNHDGSLLGTTGQDGAARVWDPATGRAVRELQSPGASSAWGPTFSPDGKLFAAAWPGEDLVIVADLATGNVMQEIRTVAAPDRATFDPAGGRLAISSTAEPIAVVFDLSSGDPLFTLEGHIHFCRMSPGARAARRSQRRVSTRALASSTPPPAANGSPSSPTAPTSSISTGARTVAGS
jgi:WD40 repeat protein